MVKLGKFVAGGASPSGGSSSSGGALSSGGASSSGGARVSFDASKQPPKSAMKKPKQPDVTALQSQIAALQAQVASLQSAASSGAVATSPKGRTTSSGAVSAPKPATCFGAASASDETGAASASGATGADLLKSVFGDNGFVLFKPTKSGLSGDAEKELRCRIEAALGKRFPQTTAQLVRDGCWKWWLFGIVQRLVRECKSDDVIAAVCDVFSESKVRKFKSRLLTECIFAETVRDCINDVLTTGVIALMNEEFTAADMDGRTITKASAHGKNCSELTFNFLAATYCA